MLKIQYRPGTHSTGLQALRNSYLAYAAKHKCRRNMTIATTKTKSIDDTLVYTKHGRIIRLQSVREDGECRGKLVQTKRDFCPVEGLDFTQVLVFQLEGSPESVLPPFPKSDVIGKCLIVGNIASIMLKEALLE